MLTRRTRTTAAIAAIPLALGLAIPLASPATASTAGAGTSAIAAAARSPHASGSAYAGPITFDHAKWCLGVAQPKREGAAVQWIPCKAHELYKQWLVDVIHTRVGNLAEVKPLSFLDFCWSEGNNATVVLVPCGSHYDQTWLIARQRPGLSKDWTLELYGRYFACKYYPVKLSTAVWSKNQAFIIQFPPLQAQTETTPAGAAGRYRLAA